MRDPQIEVQATVDELVSFGAEIGLQVTVIKNGQVGVRLQPVRARGISSRPGSTFGMVRINGSAAYVDIDSDVAVAVMRNRFAPSDLATVAPLNPIVAGSMR
jgi:hypothetical protein